MKASVTRREFRALSLWACPQPYSRDLRAPFTTSCRLSRTEFLSEQAVRHPSYQSSGGNDNPQMFSGFSSLIP
jgi:hypothetical protein